MKAVIEAVKSRAVSAYNSARDAILNRAASMVAANMKSGWSSLFAMGQEFRLAGGSTANRPYEQVPSVWKAIRALCDNVPQADLVFKQWSDDKVVYPEPLVNLFFGRGKPNPAMSYRIFMEAITGFFYLYDEVAIVKTRSIGQTIGTSAVPAELWPFNPTMFTEKLGDDGHLVGWEYRSAKGIEVFDLDEVVFIHGFNPYKTNRGLPATKSHEKIVDIDWQTLVYSKAFFDNDGTPGMMLSTDKSLTELQKKQFVEAWNKNYAGASKAHKIALLEGGLKPVTNAFNMRDMEFNDGRKFTREEILGAYRTPKSLFSITDDLNYATFTGQMKMFWIYTINPMLQRVADAFTASIVQPYDANIYCEFDYSKIPAFQEDFKDKVDIAQKMVTLGIPLNDAAEKAGLGLKRYPWGDTWFKPFGVEDVNAPRDVEPQNTDDSDDAPPPKQASRQNKARFPEISKAFNRKHAGIEKMFDSAVSRFFIEQRARVLGGIKSVKSDGQPVTGQEIVVDWSFEDAELVKRTKKPITAGIDEGIAFQRALLKVEVDASVMQRIVSTAIANKSEQIKRLNQTLRRRITAQVNESVAAGETIAELSARIRGVYNMASSRSRTIARTETTAAMNGAGEEYAKEAGFTTKQWLTSHDEAVRPDHEAMDGKTVNIAGDFQFPDGTVDYPGGDGPAAQVINCRCTVLYE